MKKRQLPRSIKRLPKYGDGIDLLTKNKAGNMEFGSDIGGNAGVSAGLSTAGTLLSMMPDKTVRDSQGNLIGTRPSAGESIGSEALKYAGMGAAFGPYGAAAGALVGGTIGLINSNKQKQELDKARAEAEGRRMIDEEAMGSKYQDFLSADYQTNTKSFYAFGGYSDFANYPTTSLPLMVPPSQAKKRSLKHFQEGGTKPPQLRLPGIQTMPQSSTAVGPVVRNVLMDELVTAKTPEAKKAAEAKMAKKRVAKNPETWTMEDWKQYRVPEPGIQYVPVESALLPSSLPLKAASKAGKAAVFAAEALNPVSGVRGIKNIGKTTSTPRNVYVLGNEDDYARYLSNNPSRIAQRWGAAGSDTDILRPINGHAPGTPEWNRLNDIITQTRAQNINNSRITNIIQDLPSGRFDLRKYKNLDLTELSLKNPSLAEKIKESLKNVYSDVKKTANETNKKLGKSIDEKFYPAPNLNDVIQSANENLKKGMGVAKEKVNIALKPSGKNTVDVYIDDVNTGILYLPSTRQSRSLSDIVLGKPVQDYPFAKSKTIGLRKYSDFPFRNLSDDVAAKYKTKGISGEINKAISEALKSKGSRLYSGASGHTNEGFMRYQNLLSKGLVEEIKPNVFMYKKDGGLVEYPEGGEVYNMKRALELGYTPDNIGHWPSVDSETGMWLKSKEHPTAWMEYMYGQLDPAIANKYNVVVNPEGYFGKNQLQYTPKMAEGGIKRSISQFVNGGYGEPNSEIENNELVQVPGEYPMAMDGGQLEMANSNMFEADGQTHEEMNSNGTTGIETYLPQGSRVFSDRVKHNGRTIASIVSPISKKIGKLEERMEKMPSKALENTIGLLKNQEDFYFNKQEEIKQDKEAARTLRTFMKGGYKYC